MVDHVVDGIITIDDGGRIETVNPAAERLFGYPAAEMLGQHINILISVPFERTLNGLDAVQPKTAIAAIDGTSCEALGRRKDGSLFAVDLAIGSFLRTGRQYFTGIIRDISERKKLKLKQQEANKRLRSVVDYVVNGIVTIDESGIVASWNRSAERIFGYTSEEMIGQNVSRLMPEPHRSHHDSHLDSYLQTGIGKVVGNIREMVAVRKDGTVFPIDIAVSEFMLQGKRLFTGIIRDITERKRADERTQFLVSTDGPLNQRRRFGKPALPGRPAPRSPVCRLVHRRSGRS